jgi:hypothetical protein
VRRRRRHRRWTRGQDEEQSEQHGAETGAGHGNLARAKEM